MDLFIVIMGISIAVLIIATFITFKFNVNIRIKGIPLKYILMFSGISLLILLIAVMKIIYGKNTKKLEELVFKLKKTKADGDIKVIDEKLNNNLNQVKNIDSQIDGLKKDYKSNKVEILNLEKQKIDISNKIVDLKNKREETCSEKESLEDKVNKMKSLIGE